MGIKYRKKIKAKGTQNSVPKLDGKNKWLYTVIGFTIGQFQKPSSVFFFLGQSRNGNWILFLFFWTCFLLLGIHFKCSCALDDVLNQTWLMNKEKKNYIGQPVVTGQTNILTKTQQNHTKVLFRGGRGEERGSPNASL